MSTEPQNESKHPAHEQQQQLPLTDGDNAVASRERDRMGADLEEEAVADDEAEVTVNGNCS